MATLDFGKVQLTWKGDWDNSTNYEVNDVVRWNNAAWICTQDHAQDGTRNIWRPGTLETNVNLEGNYVGNLSRKWWYSLANNGNDHYVISGGDGSKTGLGDSGSTNYVNVDDPNLTLIRGRTYVFKNTVHATHPLEIRESDGGAAYTDGVQNAGTDTITFTVPNDAPNTLYYQCTNHSAMGNTLTIIDGSKDWVGYNYWEPFSSSFGDWKGKWTPSTEYKQGDTVEFKGNLYICRSEWKQSEVYWRDMNMSRPDKPKGMWEIMAHGDGPNRHSAGAFLGNQAPVGWPYPHDNSHPWHRPRGWQFVSQDGTVWRMASNAGNSGSDSHGGEASNVATPKEVHFTHEQWWNGPDAHGFKKWDGFGGHSYWSRKGINQYQQRKNQFSNYWTPDGQPPKCIQLLGAWQLTAYLFNDGSVYMSGNGNNGENAREYDYSDSSYTQRARGSLDNVRIKKLSMSHGQEENNHTMMALSEDGRVFTWGRNEYGQIGEGSTQNRNSPFEIPQWMFGDEEIIDISCTGDRYASMYARTASDKIYSWGYNGYGQLGHGDTSNRYFPQEIPVDFGTDHNGIVKMVSAGHNSYNHFWVLDGNGQLWNCGRNNAGVLGHGDTSTRNSLTQITNAPGTNCKDFWVCSYDDDYHHAWYRDNTDDSTWFSGHSSYALGGINTTSTQNTPVQLPTTGAHKLTHVKDVRVTGDYSDARTAYWITDSGEAWVQGYNNYGGTGAGHGSSNWSVDGSTNYPYRTMLPGGSRVEQICPFGHSEGSDYTTPNGVWLTDRGQVLGAGYNGRSSWGNILGIGVWNWYSSVQTPTGPIRGK
jgi:alpha-tubulin suppressor-like RCC1 family protein